MWPIPSRNLSEQLLKFEERYTLCTLRLGQNDLILGKHCFGEIVYFLDQLTVLNLIYFIDENCFIGQVL